MIILSVLSITDIVLYINPDFARISVFLGPSGRMLVGQRFGGVEIELHIVLLAGRWSFSANCDTFSTFSEELL